MVERRSETARSAGSNTDADAAHDVEPERLEQGERTHR